MEQSNFLEVFTLVDSVLELGELSLNHIYLQVLVDVVDEEAHVLAELHDLSKDLPSVKVFHTPDSESPHVLQFKLSAFDGHQGSEKGVVFLNYVRSEN